MKEHLERDDFTPGEVWAFWFLAIAMSGIFLLLALVEMGMAWYWGYSIMALCGTTGVGIADFKEWRQEGYLECRQVSRQKEALQALDASAQLQGEIDEDLNGSD